MTTVHTPARAIFHSFVLFLLSLAMACDQRPRVQVVLNGWPWSDGPREFLVYATYTYDRNKVEETRFDVKEDTHIRNGQFEFSVPSYDGDLSLSLIERDGEGCKTNYYSKSEVPISFQASDNAIIISRTDKVVLNPRRCGCEEGWCTAKIDATIGGNVSESYHAVTGYGNEKILIGGEKDGAGVAYDIKIIAKLDSANLVERRIGPITSMWAETDGKSWVTTKNKDGRTDIYSVPVGNKLGEPLDTREEKDPPVPPSYERISPIIEKVSGDQTGKLQFVGSERNSGKAMLLQRDRNNAWYNDISSLNIPPNSSLYGIWVQRDGNEIWAVGSHGLVVTRRELNGYTRIEFSQPLTDLLRAIWCTEAETGRCWAVGDGEKIYSWLRRPKGGKFSFRDESLTNGRRRLNAIWGNEDGHIWAVGDSGAILSYNGKCWNKTFVSNSTLNDMWGKDKDNIWIVGASGTILISDPTTMDFGKSCNH